MRILVLFLLIFNIQSSSASEKFETGDIVDFYNDPAWVKEVTKLSETFNGLLNLVYFQNNLQSEIQIYLDEYYSDIITYDELWKELDSIENQIGTYSEDLDSFVKSINTSSSLTNSKALLVFKDSLELIYDANDYQLDNNKLTKDLLSSLAEGNIDKYNYLVSRSYLKGADFLELVSRNSRGQAERMPDRNIAKHILMVDSDVINYIAIATRVNAFQMLDELDKNKLKEIKPELDNAYKVILKGKSYSNLEKALDNFENSIKKFESLEGDYSEYIDIMKRVAINGKLLSEANIRNAESWKEIMDFFDRNINNIKNLYDSPSKVAEFNDIQSRQAFTQEQVAQYTNLYQQASLEFTKIAPELLNL